MLYEAAPLEGLTDYVFRRAHSQCFAPADRYYTPFLSPTQVHRLSAKEERELRPENNEGVNLIPQLIGHNAEDFLWMTDELHALGYTEVNLNLGCPSGTVTAKKKGAGLLADRALLQRFLDDIFEKSPLPISIKTRIGYSSAEELPALLALFGRYPIKELIVHPRTREMFYAGEPLLSAWEQALRTLSCPLCYNGNLFTRADGERLWAQFPQTERIMLGRGLVANPNLIGELRNGTSLPTDRLQAFHELLAAGCRERSAGEQPFLHHMKELWFYWRGCFENAEKPLKAIKKATTSAAYETAVKQLFRECPLSESPGYKS